MLPDDVLLEVFDFYVDKNKQTGGDSHIHAEEWIRLVHVCRRWRNVVFRSPHRLNLRLVCTNRTPARNTLYIWPPLPLIIRDVFSYKPFDVNSIIAALMHNDRVHQVELYPSPRFDYITNSAAMQEPFSELTDLWLDNNGNRGMLPDSFLGGTAPRLRSLKLICVPFLGLPKLLLSATHLVDLDIYGIPSLGYIPPEAMATSLSALTSLRFLRLHFLHPPPRRAPESRHLPPPSITYSILPSLTKILFQGASEYLEVILARIDAPRLDYLRITFFNQIIFDTPQLSQFISRSPMLRAPKTGHIEFCPGVVTVRFPSQTSDHGVLRVSILCRVSEWQLSSIEQICTSSMPPVSTLKEFYIFEGSSSKLCWQDDVENMLWLEFLRPFAAVKNLYICGEFMPRIAPALQELVEGTTEVLPTLENIFLKGFWPLVPLHKGIEKFVAARRHTSRPVAVSRWGR